MKFITSFVWKKTTEICDDLQKSSQVLPPVVLVTYPVLGSVCYPLRPEILLSKVLGFILLT